MEYTKQKFTDGQVLKAEHLNKLESALENMASAITTLENAESDTETEVSCNIPRIESLDTDNLVNLRDLESGSYILYGKFRPYAGASNILTFSNALLVNVVNKTAGSHIQVFYPVNNVVQFLAIMVDSTSSTGFTYERTDINLNDLVAASNSEVNATDVGYDHSDNQVIMAAETVQEAIDELDHTVYVTKETLQGYVSGLSEKITAPQTAKVGQVLAVKTLSNVVDYPTEWEAVDLPDNAEYNPNPLYGKKVSFLGDSICAGGSESTSYLGGYGKIIADRNNMVYENVAHGGATVTAETYSSSTGNAKPWLCRMVENMSADADYAIIEGGINDGWDESVLNKIGAITTGYDAELDDTTYYGAFESMLKQLVTRFQGKKIGYIAVPKIHSLYDSSQNAPNFYHMALECCAKWGVSVCDLNTITPPVEYLADLGTEYTADGCHPTYEGYLKYYCDPIEAWMKTLTTPGIYSVGTAPTDLDDKYVRKNEISTKKAKLTLEDGTTVLIDVVVASAGSTIHTYQNLVPTSIDTDGSVYNGVGWKSPKRLSASSGEERDVPDASITGFIPVKAGDIVRFKYTGTNKCWDTYNIDMGYNVMAYYNSSFTWLGSICPLQDNSVYGICNVADTSTGSVAGGGVVSFTVPSNSDISYLRLSFAMDSNGNMSLTDLIVTVNQEITE